MIKPILVLKQKCRYCIDGKVIGVKKIEDCEMCKGTQETEITPLRDFEKCDRRTKRDELFVGHELCECKGTGYKIPKEYEPYEIKKVSEIKTHRFTLMKEYNLKEDDKVVITHNEQDIRNNYYKGS